MYEALGYLIGGILVIWGILIAKMVKKSFREEDGDNYTGDGGEYDL